MDESGRPGEEGRLIENGDHSSDEQQEHSMEDMAEEEPRFPDDLNQAQEQVQMDAEDNGTISNQFFNQVIREQEEFIDSLNQAENQLMLDEAFILMISSVCNKKTDDYYNYDHRDSAHLSMAIEKWLLEELLKVQKLLEVALSSYNEGLVEGHLRNLQNLMKILDCPKKEVYIIKTSASQDYESGLEMQASNEHGQKVNELLNSMTVNDPDDAILSDDPAYNKFLHMLKNQNNIMKLSIGKEDAKLTVYIKGIFESPHTQISKDDEVDKNCMEEKPHRPAQIPWHILRTHLFPYFTAVELFNLRLVNQQWKSIISGMWHSIFKREMYTQFLMTNFTREIEKNFKLLSVRQPIAKKFFVYATTLSEMVKWDEVMTLCLQESNYQKKARLLVTTLLKLTDFRSIPLAKLQDFDEVTWSQVQAHMPADLKDHVQEFIGDGDLYPNVWELERFEDDFMNYSEIWMDSLRSEAIPETKNLMLLRLMIRHVLQYGVVRNSLMVAKIFLQTLKDYMNKKSLHHSPYKKGFLDGAYRIMLFKSVKIIDGEVVVMDGQEVENSLFNGMRESMMLTTLLQSLFTNEGVLRAYLKKNRKSVFRISTKCKDITNVEALANLMIEIEEEELKERQLANLEGYNYRSVPEDEPISVGSDLSSGIVEVFDSHSEEKEINHSFVFRKQTSEITVFMDSRATYQFLNDSLRYLECVRQVKRLNEALLAQFETIQQKIKDVDAMYEQSKLREEEKSDQTQTDFDDSDLQGHGQQIQRSMAGDYSAKSRQLRDFSSQYDGPLENSNHDNEDPKQNP